jgi:hypothetical protein
MRPITNPERIKFPILVFDKTTQIIVPGPDSYHFNQEIHPQGKYFSTKYKSSGSKAWNPPSSQRFYKSSMNIVNKALMHQVLGITFL